jgi:hypothetical protein
MKSRYLICEEWNSNTKLFLAWIIPRYYPGVNLFIIDKSKPFGPDNVELSKRKGKSPNLFEYKGECFTAKQWRERIGIDPNSFKKEIEQGIPIEELFEQAITRRNLRIVKCLGETKSIQKWSDEIGRPTKTLYARKYKGYQGCSIIDPRDLRKIGKVFEYNGMRKNIGEWAEYFGITRGCLSKIICRSNSFEEAINKIPDTIKRIKNGHCAWCKKDRRRNLLTLDDSGLVD